MKRLLPLVLFIGTLVTSGAQANPPNVRARFALHAIEQPTGKTDPPVCPDVGAADPNTNRIPCTDYTVTRPGRSYNWVYLVIGKAELPGINGCSFGVAYNCIYEPGYLSELSWSLCANGMAFPSTNPAWPRSGSGMVLTWETCQTTVVYGDGIHAVVGKFYTYAYSGGWFEVTPNFTNPSGPELSVNTCGLGTTNLLSYYDEFLWPWLVGRVGFGSLGFTPCLIGDHDNLSAAYNTPQPPQASPPTGPCVVAVRRSTWGSIKALYKH
jgi:hypothetical protein